MGRDLEARLLRIAERDAVLAHLARHPEGNLFLLDVAMRLGAPPPPGELRSEVAAAWRRDEVVAVAALRPSVVFDAEAPPEAIEALLPYLETLGVGLIKSARPGVDHAWSELRQRGRRRALLDRRETAWSLRAGRARLREPGPVHARPAAPEDLEALVVAARESLREEERPDPFAGDVRGFRRWVRGRVPRARVVEHAGRVVFVGYADVQLPEGWLIQGVYTWPEFRRRGFAAAGVSDLCREAFAAGADHVQLAVVEGNAAGEGLYAGLGFAPFGELRTILFAQA
jgi:RimJ/RimL family protein N-acetyltransferase